MASPDAEVSDFAVPPWRMATFRSMLWARLDDVRRSEQAQGDADDGRPAELTRFATHIELHRGLMMVPVGASLFGEASVYRMGLMMHYATSGYASASAECRDSHNRRTCGGRTSPAQRRTSVGPSSHRVRSSTVVASRSTVSYMLASALASKGCRFATRRVGA